MIDVVNERMTVHGWEGCDASVGGLFIVDLDGRYLDTLIPVIGNSRGVTGVEGLAMVLP